MSSPDSITPLTTENTPTSAGDKPQTDLRLRFLQLYALFVGGIALAFLAFVLIMRRQLPAEGLSDSLQELQNQAFSRGFFAFLGIFLLLAVVFWLIFSWQFINPLEKLESFSGRILWRSGLHSNEVDELDQLTRRTDQVGQIARSLLVMGQDTAHRFQQLSMLLETSRVVAASLDVPQVMDNILGQLQVLFEVDRAAIISLDERAGAFLIRASRGMSAEYVAHLRIAPTDPNSPSVRALRQNQPIQVADTETDLSYENRREHTRRSGHRSVLAIPLRTRHAPPTVLLLQKLRPYRYSYSELELADSFGNHASVALENAALFSSSDEKLQEQTRRLEAIVEGLNDGLVLTGLDGRILFCNHRALTLVALPRQNVLNRPITEIVTALIRTSPDFESLRENLLLNTPAQPDSPLHSQVFTRLVDEKRQDIRLITFEVTDSRGQRIGEGQLWQDITSDRDLDRMKSALLSTVSHELRTPLASIKGYATTLLARDVEWDPDTQREFLETISSETDRLAGLVKNLLDMSRIEARIIEMNCQPYALNDLVDQLITTLNDSDRERIHLRLAPDLPPALIDLSRIETVLRNLLSNAFKYSPPRTPIEIRTGQQDGDLILTVSDRGSGVPENFQDKIFDPFFRVDDGFTREVGGVGLGLAICRGFVEAHKGRIWVTSSDRGASFSFTLPAAEREPSRSADPNTLPQASV